MIGMLRIHEVMQETGLSRRTINYLLARGVIKATYDQTDKRRLCFDPSVAKFLRERYKDRMQPKTSPQYELNMTVAPVDAKCPDCGGPLSVKGSLYTTQSIDTLEMFHEVCSKLAGGEGCQLIEAWVHRTPIGAPGAPDDSLIRTVVLFCQQATPKTPVVMFRPELEPATQAGNE